MKIFGPALLAGILTLFTFCPRQIVMAKQTTENSDTKKAMDKYLQQMIELKKYSVSDDDFNNPKNAMEIDEHLKELVKIGKKTRHNPQLNQKNFKFSRDVLENHLVEMERVFRLGNKPYARWMLNSTTSICMSCHSQVPTASRSFIDFENSKTFSSDFDQAEFLFATRAFDKGSKIYDHILTGYPDNKIKPDQIEKSLERQVAYYSRIKRNPDEAIREFEKYQKIKSMPTYLQADMTAWIQQFKDWKKTVTPDPRSASNDDIMAYGKRVLDKPFSSSDFSAENPYLVDYLRVSGILYEFLQSHPESQITPQVLYWLSICDRATNSNFFYSLADLYLRECITKYPSDLVAKKCYKEYEDQVILSYSGSSGTHLPEDVRVDLEQLKKLVDSRGQIKLRVD